MEERGEDGWTREDMRAWRERLGWTQQRAADELRIHLHALRNIEGGKRPVRGQTRLLAELIERRERGMFGSAADTELLSSARKFAEVTAIFVGNAPRPVGATDEELERQVNAASHRHAELHGRAVRTNKNSEAAKGLAKAVMWLTFGCLQAHDERTRLRAESLQRSVRRRGLTAPMTSEPSTARVAATVGALIGSADGQSETPQGAEPVNSAAPRQERQRDTSVKPGVKPTQKARRRIGPDEASPKVTPSSRSRKRTK